MSLRAGRPLPRHAGRADTPPPPLSCSQTAPAAAPPLLPLPPCFPPPCRLPQVLESLAQGMEPCLVEDSSIGDPTLPGWEEEAGEGADDEEVAEVAARMQAILGFKVGQRRKGAGKEPCVLPTRGCVPSRCRCLLAWPGAAASWPTVHAPPRAAATRHASRRRAASQMTSPRRPAPSGRLLRRWTQMLWRRWVWR